MAGYMFAEKFMNHFGSKSYVIDTKTDAGESTFDEINVSSERVDKWMFKKLKEVANDEYEV